MGVEAEQHILREVEEGVKHLVDVNHGRRNKNPLSRLLEVEYHRMDNCVEFHRKAFPTIRLDLICRV